MFESSEMAFRAIEKDKRFLTSTRFFGQSFYVSFKDTYAHIATATSRTATVNIKGLILLFYFGVLAMLNRKKTEIIFFGADSGISKRSDGTIENQYAVFPDTDNAWHNLAIGNLRVVPSPRDLYNAGIIADNILLLPFVLMIRPIINVVLLLFSRANVADLCNLFSSYGIAVQEKWIRSVVARDFARYILYKALIWFSGAQKVYIVFACGRSFIINAARSLGAVSIEIQHGICGPSHRGFNYQCSPKEIAAPDFLMVSSNYWRNEALRGGFFTEENVIVVEPICKFCASGVEPAYLAGALGHKYILFTGQPPVVDIIPAQIEDVYPYLVNRDLYFVYKFHPGDSEQTITELRRRWAQFDRIILIDQVVCIKCLIRHAVAHVSFWSTCHHDAVEILDRTFVLTMPNVSHMDYYCTSLPHKFISVDTLYDIIAQI